MKQEPSFYELFFKTAIFLFIPILFSCAKKGVDPMPPPIVIPGEPFAKVFKITDSKIIDGNNAEFVPKGVNINGPYWPWPRPTLPDVNLIADVWKFNTVRLNVWQEFSSWNNYNNDMDAIVKAFTDKKIVVIIEENQFTGLYPSDAQLTTLKAWWRNIAEKYKANEYVWFNIMNEPGTGDDVPASWLNGHEAVIKSIREAGAPNIIVCDEHGYGQANGFKNTASSAALTYGQQLTSKYKNIMFSLHLYSLWVYGKERLSNYIDALHEKKLAIMLGEYGLANDASMEVATSIFKVCIPKKIGRLAWHWVGDDIHDLTSTGGGYSIDNSTGTKPANLSFAGNLVWLDTHDQLTVTDAALTVAPVIFFNNGFEYGMPANNAKVEYGWINYGTAYIDNTTENVKEGAVSIRIKEGQEGGCGTYIYLEPGKTYSITAWGKNSAVTSLSSTISLNYTTSFGGAEVTAATLTYNENTFQNKTASFTLPVNVASTFLSIYKSEATPSFWADNIVIEKQ
jgi:hypothetical protein